MMPPHSSVTWRKSSRSTGQGGQCVEVADLSPAVGIRDSKNPDGPKLFVSRPAFHSLVTRIKADHFNS